MKTLTFEQAQRQFESLFRLAASGEIVVIQRDREPVAMQPFAAPTDSGIAPAGYFAEDYSPDEIAELNALAAQAPARVLP
ncbi:MAG: hypothetical protein L0Z50_02310 [Verrucomicrobiales bacterium]|nr:hypothetical protein [Verrucomicrobiales bacterium]